MSIDGKNIPEFFLQQIDETIMLDRANQDLDIEINNADKTKKNRKNESKEAADEIQGLKKNNEDLKKKWEIILKSETETKVFKDPNNFEKIKKDYEPYLNPHMLEFSHMDKLFDEDVKKISRKQEATQKLGQDTENEKAEQYLKPTESSTAQIIYLKKNKQKTQIEKGENGYSRRSDGGFDTAQSGSCRDGESLRLEEPGVG